jgi:hypothetical protein
MEPPMDPGSQLNGEMSELERRLLEAARRDRVPDALGARMADALGMQVAGTALQGGLAAGGQLGAPLAAKAGLWGMMTLAVVSAVVGWQAMRTAARTDSTAPARTASAPAAVPESNTAARADSPRANDAEPALARTAEGDDAPLRAHGDDAALRAEIALLDQARKAVQRRASARALHLLAEHQERFVHPQLAPEASALRIEALVQRGSREQARSLSRQFMSAYPTHPLAEHVTRLAP